MCTLIGEKLLVDACIYRARFWEAFANRWFYLTCQNTRNFRYTYIPHINQHSLWITKHGHCLRHRLCYNISWLQSTWVHVLVGQHKYPYYIIQENKLCGVRNIEFHKLTCHMGSHLNVLLPLVCAQRVIWHTYHVRHTHIRDVR